MSGTKHQPWQTRIRREDILFQLFLNLIAQFDGKNGAPMVVKTSKSIYFSLTAMGKPQSWKKKFGIKAIYKTIYESY